VRIRILLVALALLFCSASGWAHDTASIVGTVNDSSGAVIPGTKVTVSNPEKGFNRELSTNTAGEYTAAKVPIGDYVITAENKGFQKLVRSGITLAVGQTLRVDLQLQVGQTTQEVPVADNAPRVETETAAVSNVGGPAGRLRLKSCSTELAEKIPNGWGDGRSRAWSRLEKSPRPGLPPASPEPLP